MKRFTILLLPLVLPASLAYSQDRTVLEGVRRWRQENAAKILREFVEILSIPNVASDKKNIRRNAETIARKFNQRGATMELLEVPNASPVVFGEIRVPGATRTIGIYVHYDGQPTDSARWTTDPWTPTLYTAPIEAGGKPIPMPGPGDTIDPEWRLYARSAGDDKAPLAALLAALDGLAQQNKKPTSNIKFLFEGEEEAGSTHLRDYFTKFRDRLDVDLWLLCDGPVHQSRRPQLTFGVRGVTGMSVTVYGATRNLHSGHYGNWAPNPALMLTQLLAGMKDENGKVLIDGFYDTVAPLTSADRRAMATMPDYDGAMRRELGLTATENNNAPYMERLLLPSLNIRGIQSATVGSTSRNIIPNQAEVSLGIRLVKGNDPEHMLDLVEAHIRKQGYHIVRQDPDMSTRLAHAKIAKVTRDIGYPAARMSMEGPHVEAIIAAVRRASSEPLVLKPSSGGSLPLYLFNEILDRPVIMVPMANHDNNQHSPNENLRLANLWYGIDLMAAILTMPE